MKYILITLYILFFSIANVAAQTDAQRPLTVDDVLNMVRIGDVLISPDGNHVFFSKSELVWDKNNRKKTFYIKSTDGGEARQYISDAGGGVFKYSPDGKYLSFIRSAEDQKQIFLMPTSGGEAVQYTKNNGEIQSYKWSTDSQHIFFIAEEALSEEEQKEHDLGADPIFIDEGPNGKNEGSWTNLWKITIADKHETRITDEDFLIEGADVSPDNKHAALIIRRENRVNLPQNAELYLVDIDNKSVERITDNLAPESSPLWSPDGKTLLYRAPSDKDFYLTNGYFWVMDTETLKRRQILTQNQGEVNGVVWMPDSKSILYNESQEASMNLYKLEITADKITPLTNVNGTLRALSFSKDRTKMVYSYSDFNTPDDIYVSSVDNFKPVQLTNANPWIKEEIRLGKAEALRWKSKGGMEIEGVFYLPGDYREGTKIPLVLFVHGGPSGYFANRFRTDFHIYTGLGYAVLGPNVRGSSGYGDDILRGLIGEVGDGEYHDLMNGVDHVINLGYIDPDQLGIRGWSWGGVSSGYTITQTQRFKAASVGAGVFNWAAEVGPGFSFDVGLWYIGEKPWTNSKEWVEHSAITHVENVTTATLLLHGGNDQTSSVGQSLMYFTAIKDIGKAPVRYIKFPRQGHGVREPRLKRILNIEEIKWMQKYVRGIDWKPWERNKPVDE